MALQVIQRPEEQLFVEENPTIYDTPYYTSRFNAANLPLVYKISNTKFPENTEDVIEDILSVSNNAGFAQLTLNTATYTFLDKGTVEITNTTSYNGVWSIRSVIDSDNIVINAPFVADETGNVQNYYNNYSTLVKVYSGLPEYHPLNSTKPMTLITDNPITVTPNSDNEATVDVSALVKSQLNLNNDYDINDIDLFNAFYIEYSEQYDESDGTTVSVTTETFTPDLIEGCDAGAADFITNGDFATDLTGWTNTGTGIAWAFDTGAAQTTLSVSNRDSQTLFQDELGLTNGVEYDISFDYNTGGEDVKFTVGLGFDNIYQATLNGSGTISFKTIFSGNSTGSFSGIAFTTELLSTPASSIDVRLDNVTLLNQLTNPCLAYIFSSHSALQPQSKYGGNMGEYVQNFNGGVFANKWLTLMQEPVLFKGNYFDLSTLIPQAVIQSAIQAGGFFLQIIEFDQNGTVIEETNYPITQNLGDGIYRFRLDDKKFNTNTNKFTSQILRIPVNLFVDGDQGTFDTTTDPSGDPPSDWNLTTLDSSLTFNNSVFQSGTGSLQFQSLAESAETTALISRMNVAPTLERRGAIDRLVKRLVANGIWDELDLFYVCAAHDEQASRLNWKGATNTLTRNGTTTFIEDVGFKGDGSTGYLGTGYNPAVDGVNFTLNSAGISAFNNNGDNNTGTISMGVKDGTDVIVLLPISGGQVKAAVNNATGDSSDINSGFSTCLTSAQRLNATDLKVSVRDEFPNYTRRSSTATVNSTAVPSRELYLMARNNEGVADAFAVSTFEFAAFAVGSGAYDHEVLEDSIRKYLVDIDTNLESFEALTPTANIPVSVADKEIFYGSTDISLSEGDEYLIEGYVRIDNKEDLDKLYFTFDGYTFNDLDSATTINQNSTLGTFIKINTSFTVPVSGTYNLGLYQQADNEGAVFNGYVDTVSLKGPLDTLTEKKTIIYDSGCLYKNFHVKFLDSLGGYSYWTFRTYGDKGVNFGDTRTIKRNIFSDFPTGFKDAQVQTDFVGVESKDTVTLRAENLTEQQAIDLFELVRSVRVYDINGTTPKVLIVDKSSISITQGEKLYNLTFNATSTFDNYRQRQ